MSEKLYETYAKKVQLLLHNNDRKKELTDIVDNIMAVRKNPRYSDIGKEELLKDMREEFANKNKAWTEALREVIQDFCNKYGVEVPDDGESHSVEVANVLQIIDMCGFDLSADILKAALEPVKNSGTVLKMISDVMYTRAKNSSIGGHCYKSEVFELLDDYLGMNNEMLAYSDTLESITALLTRERLIDYSIQDDYQYGVENGTRLVIQENTPYSVYCLGDNMMKVGKMHDEIKQTDTRFFK